MRISNELLIERFLRTHREIMDRLEKASYQLSTGKRLEAPSDDPSGESQILGLKRSIEEMNRFLDNINLGDSWLSVADSAFDKLDRYIERVRTLSLQGANDTQDADSRRAIAEELGQIFGELVEIGNTKAMGRYIFGGTKTDRKPFAQHDYNAVKLGKLPESFSAMVTIETAPAFSDLYQFDSGKYTLYMKREGNGIKVWLEDESGNVVQIDSNGSDDSGTSQNVFTDRAVFVPSIVDTPDGKLIYGTFDTGRGIKIDISGLKLSAFDTLKVVDLEYTRGGEISYQGNGEEQKVQVGYNRYVAVNVPGEGVFKPTHRILAAQSYDVDLVESMPWGRLGVPTGASYRLSGLTHNGEIAGSAYVISPEAVDFEGLGGVAASVNATLELRFSVNEAASTGNPADIYSASITINLPAHYESIDQVVDVIKAALDANSVLRDKVEVTAEGDHIVFYTIKPGVNYLYVKEFYHGSSGTTASDFLGFGSGVGSWGVKDIYTVSQRVRGRAVTVLTAASTFEITTNTSHTVVSVSRTDTTPLYTVEKLEPRLFEPISAGATVVVSANGTTYTWTAPEDIETLDELAERWNVSSNWTDSSGATVEPPVAMVNEDDSHYRFVSLLDTDSIKFSDPGGVGLLYRLGVGTDASQNTYALSRSDPDISRYMRADEFTALRVAYAINRAASGMGISARTDGKGGIEVVSPEKAFDLRFDPSSEAAKLFPTRKDEGTGKLISRSQIDTVRELIRQVEDLYRGHVKGFVGDGRLYFKDKLGGPSLFDLEIRKNNEKAKTVLGRFFVAQEGEGVDVFDVVKDLEEAHAENIPRRMIGQPSQWVSVEKGDVIHTTILPMTDGEFKGDYNTTWHVKIDLIKNGRPIGEGYTGVFARHEARIVAPGQQDLFMSAVGTFTFIDTNGEKTSLTVSSSSSLRFTVTSVTTDVGYRIYLEDGSMSVDTASGTVEIDGKMTLMVEDDYYGRASCDGQSFDKVKFISYTGHLKIYAPPTGEVHRVSDEEKHNLLVSIEDSRGKVVKTMVIKDPYRQYYVRDGVYLSFSSGFVKSGDSFTVKVGGGISEKIDELDEAYNQVLRRRTDVGARMESLKMSKNRYQIYIQHAQDAKAPLEDVDLTEATVNLQKAQTALRAALLSAVRMFSPTLLDFMR